MLLVASLAPDVLLAGLERKPERLAPAAVHRDPDDPSRHGATILFVGGEVGRRAARHSRGGTPKRCELPTAMSAPNSPGGRQQDEAQKVCRYSDDRPLCMRLLDDPAVIGHPAAGLWVLQQDAEERPLREPCAVIAHLHLDADGVCAGLHPHRDGLWQAGGGDKEAVAAVLGDAVAHVHGLGRRRGLVEQRGVGAGEAGEVHHHGLEVEQRFEPALRDFRLIGCIRGVPAWILQDVALDDGRRDRIVVAEADHGARDAVAPGKLCQFRQRVPLCAAFRKVLRNPGTDRFRHSGIHERVEGFVAHGFQHGRQIVLAWADMPADEGVRLLQSRQ